jgi:ketosteroid isomerase-like protein
MIAGGASRQTLSKASSKPFAEPYAVYRDLTRPQLGCVEDTIVRSITAGRIPKSSNEIESNFQHPPRGVIIAAFSREVSMTEQQNIEIVKRGYEAFGRGDINGVLALCAENVEWVSSGPSELPTAGIRRGREQVAQFFKAVDQVFEIQRFEPKQFIAQGDQVVVLGDDTAKVKATGKVLTEEWAHAFAIRDGKIAAFREYIDTAQVVAELRAAPARS